MQKLKNRVLDKMMQARLTKAEVDFMLEISHYQDDSGVIYGVYYKDICKAIEISYDTFYVTMKALVDKGLINLKKEFYGDWNIIIIDNDFSYPEALKEGYISTGHDLFYNNEFRKMKANEKLLAMQFLKIAGAGKRYHIGIELFYEKYAELLQVTKRTIRVYLSRLKSFFNIKIKNKTYLIKPLDTVFKFRAPSDLDNFSEHLSTVACRRNRASYTKETKRNISGLVIQYKEQLQNKIAHVFFDAVQQSIEKSNKEISNKNKWNRNINPKFIHKLMINIAFI